MHAQRKLVSFIGIGAGSVTPLLYSYLKTHPALFVLSDETGFFSSTKVYSQGIDWYESLFKVGKSQGLLYGELAGTYLKNAQAAALIVRTYPSAKLLAVVENPLVSVRLAYVEARHSRTISAKTSLPLFLKQNPEVLANARYGRQLAQYFGYYAPTDLMVLLASDIEKEPLASLEQVFKHLDIDSEFVPTALKHLIVGEEETVAKRPGVIKRSFRFIKKLFAKAYHFIWSKFNRPAIPVDAALTVARKLPLSPELEQYLKDYFKQDVLLLSNLLHRNLNVEWEME